MFPFNYTTIHVPRPVPTAVDVNRYFAIPNTSIPTYNKRKLTSLTNKNAYQTEYIEQLLNCPEYVPSVYETGWFYSKDNNSIGPIKIEHLKQLYLQNTITQYTYVFNYDQGQNWFRICDYQPLHHSVHTYQCQSDKTPQTNDINTITNKVSKPNKSRSEKQIHTNVCNDNTNACGEDKHVCVDNTHEFVENCKEIWHKIESIWNEQTNEIRNDRYVIFDHSELKIFQWDITPGEPETFYIRFEPLMETFDFELKINPEQIRKNETMYRLIRKNVNDLRLKNKIDSLLCYINSKNKPQNEISIDKYATVLLDKIK
eukprot:8455_1